MPNYTVPPWIKGAETAANYGRGYGLGLQGGEAQSRLALEAARLSQENNRISAGFIQEQARLDIEKAYQEQKLDLARQEFASHQQEQAQHLAAEKQRMDLEAKQAANRFAAQQQFQAAIASGADLPSAALNYAAGMGATNLTPEVNMLRYAKPPGDPSETSFGGEPFLKVPQPGGGAHYQQIHKPDEETKARLQTNAEFNRLSRVLAIAQKRMQQKYPMADVLERALSDPEAAKALGPQMGGQLEAYKKDRAALDSLQEKLNQLGGVSGDEEGRTAQESRANQGLKILSIRKKGEPAKAGTPNEEEQGLGDLELSPAMYD